MKLLHAERNAMEAYLLEMRAAPRQKHGKSFVIVATAFCVMQEELPLTISISKVVNYHKEIKSTLHLLVTFLMNMRTGFGITVLTQICPH